MDTLECLKLLSLEEQIIKTLKLNLMSITNTFSFMITDIK